MTDEQLTDEEREELRWFSKGTNVAKLLRLHDRYKARVEELERIPHDVGATNQKIGALRESSLDWREKCKAAEARVAELEMRLKAAHDAIDMWGDKPPG